MTSDKQQANNIYVYGLANIGFLHFRLLRLGRLGRLI